MIRVLIAEQRAIVRRGVRETLADTREMEVAGEAETAADLRRLLAADAWDVLMLNLRLPGSQGIAYLADVRALAPSLPVIAYSNHPDDQFGREALALGAASWVPRAPAPEELIETIRRAAERAGPAAAAAPGAVPHEALSDREFAVMREYAAGRGAKQIAAHLGISPKTVSTYRARILSKLGLRTTADIVRYAMRRHLVD